MIIPSTSAWRHRAAARLIDFAFVTVPSRGPGRQVTTALKRQSAPCAHHRSPAFAPSFPAQCIRSRTDVFKMNALLRTFPVGVWKVMRKGGIGPLVCQRLPCGAALTATSAPDRLRPGLFQPSLQPTDSRRHPHSAWSKSHANMRAGYRVTFGRSPVALRVTSSPASKFGLIARCHALKARRCTSLQRHADLAE